MSSLVHVLDSPFSNDSGKEEDVRYVFRRACYTEHFLFHSHFLSIFSVLLRHNVTRNIA